MPYKKEKHQGIDFKAAKEIFGFLELMSILNFMADPTDENALLCIEARLEDERWKYWSAHIPEEHWPEALKVKNWGPGLFDWKALRELLNSEAKEQG